MTTGNLFFDQRFLTKHAGTIITDPTTAVVELVANAWDAYATQVSISWPYRGTTQPFTIQDNGKGMSAAEFEARWSTLDYDRLKHDGAQSTPPADLAGMPPRQVYGRNGRGRHAAFCFGESYQLTTWRDGEYQRYLVEQTITQPISWRLINSGKHAGHGTEIVAIKPSQINVSQDQVREAIGMRFLLDPNFVVAVNGTEVSFEDIPKHVKESICEVPLQGTARILMIDSLKSDRTTKHHGIAWRVLNRLVGKPGWGGSDYERILDGRTREAKRYTFLVFADFLSYAVKPDWSGFDPNHVGWHLARTAVQDHIKALLRAYESEEKSNSKALVKSRVGTRLKLVPPAGRDRWNAFVDEVIESCPSISTDEVTDLAEILAKLEQSSSKYGLISQLHAMPLDDLDRLHQLLSDWTVQTAKAALDEIQTRLKLIAELDAKIRDLKADELHDLQPLFERGLWIFGPQFESIEFTSNRGMSEVIRRIFGKQDVGSRNRPDFVILPDSSLGFYSRDGFGADHEASRVASLVIVELKKPGKVISTEEKGQAWKYVKELIDRGMIDGSCEVNCFVLGSSIDPTENSVTTHYNEMVRVHPFTFSMFLRRAESRMLNLRSKLADAPFLKEQGLDVEAFVAAENDSSASNDLFGPLSENELATMRSRARADASARSLV
ncbi:ATP-binding protein [Terrarubrum flagellatum]|uniref:ATP-binding protein n=1 Tax=Terrirubrum flagellatum TaxID=2895980 RepID=UPI0031451981